MRCTHSPHGVPSSQRLWILVIALSGIINNTAHCNPTPWETPQKLLICQDPLGQCFLSAVDPSHPESLNVINDIDKLNCGVSDLSTIATNEIIEVFTGDKSRKYDIICKSFNLVPHEMFSKIKARSKRQSSYPRGRFRGQTQSQYLNIGNDGNEGKAEAQSVADSSRAIVTGTSGMGQAQSQTIYDPGCEECGQASDPGIDSLRRYPDANKDKNNFGQPITGRTNQSPYKPFSTTAQQPDSRLYRQETIPTGSTIPGLSRGSDIQSPGNQFGPSTNGPDALLGSNNGQSSYSLNTGGGTSQGPVGPYGTIGSGTNGPSQDGSGGSGIYGQIPGDSGLYRPNQGTRGTYEQSPGGTVTYGQGPSDSGNFRPSPASDLNGPQTSGSNKVIPGVSGPYGQSPERAVTHGQGPFERGNYEPNSGSGPIGPGSSGSKIPNTGVSGPYGQSPGVDLNYGPSSGSGPGGSESNTPNTGQIRTFGQIPIGSSTFGQSPGGSGNYGQSPGGSGTYGQIPGGDITYGQGPSVSANYGPSAGSGLSGPTGIGSNIPNPDISGPYGQSTGGAVPYGQSPGGNGIYRPSPGSGPTGPNGSGPYGLNPAGRVTYGQTPGAGVTYGQSPGGSVTYGQSPGGSGTYGQSPGGSNTYGQSPGGTVTYGHGPGGSGNYGPGQGGPNGPGGSGSNILNTGISTPNGKVLGNSGSYGQNLGGGNYGLSPGSSGINRPNTDTSGPHGQSSGGDDTRGQSPGSSGIPKLYNPAGINGIANKQSSGESGDSSVTNVPQNIVSTQQRNVWPQIGPNGEKYVCCLVNSNYPSTPEHGGSNQPQGLPPNQITGNFPGASYGPSAPQQTGNMQPGIQLNQQSSLNGQENVPYNIMNGARPNQQNQLGQPGSTPENIYSQSNQPQGTLGSIHQQPYNQDTSPYGGGTPQTTGISSNLPYDTTKAQNPDSIFQGSVPYNPSNNGPGESVPGSSGQSHYSIPQGTGVNNSPDTTVPTSNWNTNPYTTGGNFPNKQSPGIGQNGTPLQTGQTGGNYPNVQSSGVGQNGTPLQTGQPSGNYPNMQSPGIGQNGLPLQTGQTSGNYPNMQSPGIVQNGMPLQTGQTGANYPNTQSHRIGQNGMPLQTGQTGGNIPNTQSPRIDHNGTPLQTGQTGGNYPNIQSPGIGQNGNLLQTGQTGGNYPNIPSPGLSQNGNPLQTGQTGGNYPNIQSPGIGQNGNQLQTGQTSGNYPNIQSPGIVQNGMPLQTGQTGGNYPNIQSSGLSQNGMPLQTGQTYKTLNSQNLPQSFSQQGDIPGSAYPGHTDSGYNIYPYNNQGGGSEGLTSHNNGPTGTLDSNQGYNPNGSPNVGATQGVQNIYGKYPQDKQPGVQGSSFPGSSIGGSGINNYITPGLAGGPGPYNGYVPGSDGSAPGIPSANQGSQNQLPSSSYDNQGSSNPNRQPNYSGTINGLAPDGSIGIPQNVVDPNSIAATYNDDSEALVSVSQDVNGTVASASSKGGNDKGRAQTQVEGTYTGTGSFSAQAQISDDTKGAESHVSGGKHGATSSALGKGRNNKSQAQVQLGSETGSLQTQAGTDGVMHSSNSQVQGSVKGGMADAQARGPGSTSSQAQIGFTPYKESEKAVHDTLKSPFVGGGTASAHSTGRTGQSQTQLQGTFKYGISYNGAAQSGASLDKDTVFANRLSFNKLDVFDENNKNINVNVEQSANPPTSGTQTNDHPHSDHHNTRADQQNVDAANPANGRRSFKSSQDNNAEYEYPTDKDDNQPYEYETDGSYDPEVTEGDYPNYDDLNREPDPLQPTQQNSGRKSLDVKQTLGGNTQHIVLGPLHNRDAQIVQQSSDSRPDENRIYQPGELVPGTGGYTIPIGFTGSVKAVSSKGKTFAIGSKDSPSQAQTVSLTPGTGQVKYDHPRPTYSYGRNVPQQDLRSLDDKQEDSNRYMSVSKSVTGALDSNNNVKKQYSHTYYTKSSSCGYFTFTCTIVSGSNGRKKVCRPKIPTNPDGTPMKC